MNDKILEFYDEKYLYNLLANTNNYSKLLNSKINRYKTDNKVSNVLEFDLLEAFIISSFNNSKYISLIHKYTSFIFGEFLKKPSVAQESSLLLDERYAKRLFNREQLSKLLEFRKRQSIKYNSYMNNPDKLSIDFLKYAISLIQSNVTSPLVRKTYKYLINNIKDNNNKYAYEFIIKYTAYLAAKELKVKDYNIYYTDFDWIEDMYLDCSGSSYPGNNVILLNSSMNKKNNELIKVIQIVGHEMKHLYQYSKYKSGEISKDTLEWTIYKVFCTCFNDEYDNNYDNLEVENDANNYGWDLTARIYSAYSNDKGLVKYALNRKDRDILKGLASLKQIGKNNISNTNIREGTEYNTKYLDGLVEKHPIIISEHYLLYYIYNKQGKRYSFEDMVYFENDLNSKNSTKYSNIKNVYKPFYLYEIGKGIEIDLNKYNETRKKQIINKLIDLATDEILKIDEIKTLSKKFKKEYTFRINIQLKTKLKRISNVISYLNQNSRAINELSSNVINTKIQKMLVLLDEIDINLNNDILTKLFYRKNTYSIQQTGYKLSKSIF